LHNSNLFQDKIAVSQIQITYLISTRTTCHSISCTCCALHVRIDHHISAQREREISKL
jgi:hypothetical protein